MGGIETVAAAIGADLAARLPRQNKKQREGLALLVATALDVRDVNLMELAAALPRAAERLDMRYQWISRLLGNPLIDTDAVMAPFAREVLARASAQAHTLVLIIDQSQVNATHQMVMVSLRVGGRALPLAWRVKKTQGAIGFAEQRAALDRVAALLPAGGRPVLMGDRFYGSPALIAWGREQDWGWRLRLKQDLLVFEAGGETTLAECFRRGEHLLSDVELTEQRVRTNVSMVQEAGHPEPWIIALSQTPSVHTAFDYGLRWGIEAMFSDFKSRGFGLEDSQIRLAGRLDRLILVMALALFWAVSTGHVGCRPSAHRRRKKLGWQSSLSAKLFGRGVPRAGGAGWRGGRLGHGRIESTCWSRSARHARRVTGSCGCVTRTAAGWRRSRARCGCG